MHIELKSLADELSKIAEAQENAYTKDKLMRAAGVGLASSGAFGLGWGLGDLLAHKGLIPLRRSKMPILTPAQAKKGLMAVGALGAMGSLAKQLWLNKAMQYIDGGVHQK
jgi:hypothetical protein